MAVTIQRLVSIAVAVFVVIGGVAAVRAADSMNVKLEPQNNSTESGSATLTKSGDQQTKVVLNVEGAPSTQQPVHIHKGTCDKLDPKPAYPLSFARGARRSAVAPRAVVRGENRNCGYFARLLPGEAEAAPPTLAIASCTCC